MANETVPMAAAGTSAPQDLGTTAGIGVLSGNDYSSANAAPTAATPAPTAGTSPLQPNPPAGEPPAGIASAPGSFQDKLSTAIAAIGAHPNAPAVMAKPGGWARAMLGGVMSALSSGADRVAAHGGIGSYFPGSENARGPLGSLMGALNQQSTAAQAARDKARKDKNEQETHDTEILKDKAAVAASNSQKIHSEQAIHLAGQTAVDESIERGKKRIQDLVSQEGNPAEILAKGVKADDIPDEIMAHLFKPSEDVPIPDGKVDTLKKNEDGTPIYETTYSLVHLPPTKTIGEEEAAQMTKDLGRPVSAGQVVSGATWAGMAQEQDTKNAATALRNKALVDAGIVTQAEADKMEKANLKPIWNGAMADSIRKGADVQDAPVAAYKTLQYRAATDPEFAKKYPNLEADIKDAYGEKNLEKLVELHADHVNKMAEERLKKQEKDDLAGNYKGNQSLSGPAYLASLPPAERGIVQGIGTAQLPLNRLEYLAARKPEVLEAVMQAYPGFQGSTVAAYVDNVKNYTNTSPNKTGGQLIAGAAALGHLKRLMDINNAHPLGVHVGVGKMQSDAAQEYDNLLDTVADELVTFYAEPKTNEALASKKKTLGATINRNAAIMEQGKAMGVRFDELESHWNDAIPSDAYRKPMPNVSPLAKQNRAALDPEYAKRLQSGQQNTQTGQQAGAGAPPSSQPQHPAWAAGQQPVLVNGQIVGYSSDGGKTMTPVQSVK